MCALSPKKNALTHLKAILSNSGCNAKGLALSSLVFALIGFSYNVWRLELSESNTTVRTACFEMILELSQLEQIIYANVYDNNLDEGSPRKAWVKVGVIVELSQFTSPNIKISVQQLHKVWSEQAAHLSEPESVTTIIEQMDKVREDIQAMVQTLK